MDPYRSPAEVDQDLPKARAPRKVEIDQVWEWRKDGQTRKLRVDNWAYNSVNCWGITWLDNGKGRWVHPDFFDDCVLVPPIAPYRSNSHSPMKKPRLSPVDHFNAFLKGASILTVILTVILMLTVGVYYLGDFLTSEVYHVTQFDVGLVYVEKWIAAAATLIAPFVLYWIVRLCHYMGLPEDEIHK